MSRAVDQASGQTAPATRAGLLVAQRAILQSGLSAHAKLVMFAILDHWSRRQPHPYVGVTRLCRLTSLSRATMLRTLKRLEQDGALAVRHGGPNKANQYDLAAAFEGRLPCIVRSHGDTGPGETPVSLGDPA